MRNDAARDMTHDALVRECGIFVPYLLGCATTPYIIDKYADAHRVSAAYMAASRFDAFLLRAARTNRHATRLADAYAAVLAPTSLLRRKLILLLAILETSAPSARIIDSVDDGGRALMFTRLFARGFVSVLSLLIGALLFVPARLILAGPQRPTA